MPTGKNSPPEDNDVCYYTFLFKWSIESYGRLTRSLKHADPVVQKFDGTIHWLTGYPVDKC